jgi:energy-coupling factor transporter ATP-binding protein EcfA2
MPSSGKVTCPYCFQEAHPNECAIVSGVDGRVLKEAPKGLMRFPTGPHPLPSDLLPRYQCPNQQCLKAWPDGIDQTDNHFIALVGTPACGKSTYLAMLLDTLAHFEGVQRAMGVASVAPSTEDDERRYAPFRDSLIKDHRPFQGTVPVREGIEEPVIYRLDFAPGKSKRRPLYLYFYDISGEDMAEEKNAVQYAQCFSHASAIILLADPFAMPNVHKFIHKSYYPSVLPQTNPSEVLFRVVELYERRVRHKLNIPLAIAFSKSDLLRVFDPHTQSSLFVTPNYYHPAYDQPLQVKELEQTSADVQKLLQTVGDTDLVTWTAQFPKVGFFAVSATGWPPNPGTYDYPDVVPLRVLDPVLWVLLQLGVIQAG